MKKSRFERFRHYLKRSITPGSIRNSVFQAITFVICVALLAGVVVYAINKSYDRRELSFVDSFTITAHTGSFNTAENSIPSVEAAIENDVEVLEIDIRSRPDNTLVISHDMVLTNSDGVPLEDVLSLLQGTNITVNLDIKETKVLNPLYDVLERYGMVGRVLLTGIEEADTETVKNSRCASIPYYLNCRVSRTRIFTDSYKKEIIELLQKTGAVGINCNYRYASSTLANLLHDNGYKLSVWTVNTSYAMKRMLISKPDNITTKEYERLTNLIENWG